MYSAITDWRNGERDPIDFTTGAYIDVYDGNINTLKNMKDQYPNKYHNMMADIYAKVRCVPDSFDKSQYLQAIYQLDDGEDCSSNCQHPY